MFVSYFITRIWQVRLTAEPFTTVCTTILTSFYFNLEAQALPQRAAHELETSHWLKMICHDKCTLWLVQYDITNVVTINLFEPTLIDTNGQRVEAIVASIIIWAYTIQNAELCTYTCLLKLQLRVYCTLSLLEKDHCEQFPVTMYFTNARRHAALQALHQICATLCGAEEASLPIDPDAAILFWSVIVKIHV